MLLGFFVHDDGLGPLPFKTFATPFSRSINTKLRAVAQSRRRVIENVDRSFDEYRVAFGVDMIAGDPHHLGKIVHVYVMIHQDRKSTRLNSSHLVISYAVLCL